MQDKTEQKKEEVTLRYCCAENEDDKQTDNYNRGDFFLLYAKRGENIQKHP